MHDLKEASLEGRPGIIKEERRESQGVEERRSLILEISALLYNQMRRLGDLTLGKKEDGGRDTNRRIEL